VMGLKNGCGACKREYIGYEMSDQGRKWVAGVASDFKMGGNCE